ncbi:hypothetical protein CC86DRAFT_124571 [Ophiobolus disseminans]|uniref:Vacuolar ATPase assembly protein VMA22 n=1 Tax=Ophiobolus disseminans TaxID=1469910 RepID=A0A6A6ZIG8_9PLEO|nr:hypothetical protein CC86DRAFT_124571 [Ophiobolus disseminans]
MAQVQSQPNALPETKSEVPAVEKDALITRLDSLLEQYLHTLDKYQKTREQLSKQLSAGYLSLAQANFQNRSTTHYGQDSYDERMQATRKMYVSLQWGPPQIVVIEAKKKEKNINPRSNISAQDDSNTSRATFSTMSERHEVNPPKNEEAKEQQSEKPHIQEPDSYSAPRPKEKDDSSKTTKKSNDPLRWFGILVPPALRSAQHSFISVVEGPVPQLASIARDLRGQEIEIGRVRKQIKKL